MKKIFLLAFLALFMIRAFAQPSSAAPTPTASAASVISLFSDSYTNVSGTTWRPDWGQGTAINNLTVDGVSTIEYSNLSYEGVQLSGTVDASLMDSVHLDVWSADCTTLNFFLINTATGVQPNVAISLTPSAWTSVTLPLSNYSAVVNHINQMMFTGNGTIYLQNIYFRQTAGAPIIPTITGFSIPATQTEGTNYTINDPTSNSSGAFTYTSSNTAVATISGNTITAIGPGTTTITVNQAADPSNNFLAGSTSSILVVPYPVPTNPYTPKDSAVNVISLFGNYYTQNSNATGNANGNPVWYQNWGQQTAVTYWNIGGDTTIEYTNLNYQGVQLKNPIDISAMDTLNIDIWTPNLTSLFIDIIGSSGEKDLSYSLTQTGWNHLRIPLINYASAGLTGFIQFKFEATTSGGVIFLQNIYFVNAVGKPSLSGFTIPTQIIGVNSTYTLNPTSNSTGAITYSSSNTSVATISDNVITIVGAGTSTISAVVAADANYSSATFTTTLTVDYAAPATAAAVPSIASQYVISLWGNAYTNVSGTSWYPNWGQSTQYATPTIGGKSTIKYSALNYQGVQFASNIDASLMDSLRVNIWTPNATSLQIFLINTFNSVEQFYTVSLTTNGWNNVSIPLSAYDNIDLTRIGQFKIVAVTPGSGAVIYLQNFYFMNVVGKPTITGFSIPTQTLGTPTYTITNPSSNSTGAFTYSSSNTSVATVSGHTITIKGVGTTTITATQATDNNYLSGSVTALLTVAYPGPATAAAVPSASPSSVTSLWGNTYTNVSGTSWSPIWGQNPLVTTTILNVGSKTTLEYSTLTYQGVQFSSGVNVSSRNLLHFDVWSPNCTSFDFYLINTDAGGVNQMVTVTPTINGWNSINIPLSNFTSQVISNINQMKIVANTPSSNAVLYFQNIYFVNATPTWAGTVSTDFSNAANWQYGLTPIASNTPTIPAALAKQPALSANAAFTGITLNGSLSLNGHLLTLTGALTGSGSLKGSTTSSLAVAGTVGTINFDQTANNLQNLTITSGSATLGNALNVFGTFTPTSGTITTGGNLTLKSTSVTNTAVVGIVGGTVSGKVTVERFIPNSLRVFRDLGAGGVANAGSIFNNWQEGGVTNNGYGTQITGIAGTPGSYDNATGFDYSLFGGKSLYTFTNNTWDSITVGTKNTTLDPFQGYRLLVRGNRTNDLSQQFAINMTGSATLRSAGNLVYGNVTYNVGSVSSTNNYVTSSGLVSGANNYSFISNPYASVVDWEAVITTNSSNVNENYWYCDPTFTTGGNGVNFIGYTQFVAYSATAHSSSNTFSKSNVGRYLQPGQAIFVQNPASGTPSLKFTESCKVPAQARTGVFGTVAVNRIAVGLFKNGANLDGAVSVFDKNFSTGYGNEDAVKFANATENMTFNVAGKDLAINGSTLPSATDVLPIRLSNLVINTAYSIKLDASQFSGNGLQAYLRDNVLNTKTLLVGSNNAISFKTTSVDVASYVNRYSIVFSAGILPVSDIKLTATAQSGDVQVAWTVVGESNVASYTVQHSVDGASFSSIATVAANSSASYSVIDSKAVAGTNYYRIKVSSNDGTVSYSNVVELTTNNSPLTTIAAYPNPLIGARLNVALNHLDAGKYSIAFYNVLGAKVVEKSITHVGGNAVEQLTINSHLAAGAYTVRVSNANGVSYQSQIEVK